MSAKSLIMFVKTVQIPRKTIYYKTRLKNSVTIGVPEGYIFSERLISAD